jgi:hypothetical protein
VTYRRVLDWTINFIDTLYIAHCTTGNYSAIAITTLYSLLLHPLVSSVFTTWIHKSHCNFIPHMKSSFHSLTPFLLSVLSYLGRAQLSTNLAQFSLLVRVRVTLRLVVCRQSVRHGAKPLETHGQRFFFQLNPCAHSPL